MNGVASMVPRPTLVGTTITYPVNLDSRCTLERALAGVAGAGFEYVELADAQGYCEHLRVDSITDQEVLGLQRLLADHELTAYALSVSTDLTEPAGIARLQRTLEIADMLGTDKVVTAIQRTDTPAGMAGFLAQVPQIDSLLQKHGCLLLLETHRGAIRTGIQGVDLLSRLTTSRILLTYDTANVLNRGGVLPHEDLLAMGDSVGTFIGHVQLKDKTTLVPGETSFPIFGRGVLDFGAILTTLHTNGYRGAMTLEVELPEEGDPDVLDQALAESVTFLSRFWK